MHAHYDPFGPMNQHRQVLSNLRRQRRDAALRRLARAQRRQRSRTLEALDTQAVARTFT